MHLGRDIRYALRSFRRAPLVAFTVVATVALGLGLVAVAFTIFNTVFFREDRVPNVREMYAVQGPRNPDGERAGFTRAQIDSLRRETSLFTDVYGEMAGIDVRVDGRLLLFTLTTGNFFDVVGVKPALGRALRADDDEPGRGRTVAVLSDRGWERLFGRDPGAVGRTIEVHGVPFEIVGVMPRDFRGLAIIAPDYWVPLASVGHLRPAYQGREANVEIQAVGRLKPGLSRETALAGLAVWAAGLPKDRGTDRGTSGITLLPWRGTVQESMDAVAVTGPLFLAFGLILVIGCANVTNLLLARAVSRQREIGIRLSLGAARRRIVRQLLTESLLLALLAAGAGFAISRLALDVIIRAVTASWPPEIGNIHLVVPEADWRVALFLLGGAVVSTLSFALLPALQATRVEPVAMMRGEVLRQTRPGRARGLLIGLQVGVSTLLLISATVFLRSALAASVDDSGMRTSDSVTIGIASEATRPAAIQALAAEPLVDSVAASRPAAILPPQSGLAEIGRTKTPVGYRFVSPEYFAVLGVSIIRGRSFAPDEQSPVLPIAIVSETAARMLWPDRDPLGQVLRLEREPESKPAADDPLLMPRAFTVVGIARDVAGFRVMPFAKSAIYLPSGTTMSGTALTARVHGDPDVARQKLADRLGPADGRYELGTTSLVTRMETYFLSLAFWITTGLGTLALILTVSGLFSVLCYLVEQRTREIGVRMALGATASDVATLVLRQSLGPVGIGIGLGGATAVGLSQVLRSTAGAAIAGGLVHVLDPVAYAAGLLIILAACVAAASIPARRATRVDPMQTLRAE